jgi:hypothetical protein
LDVAPQAILWLIKARGRREEKKGERREATVKKKRE